VRIGDSDEDKTDSQVESVLKLHVEEGCWSSPPGHDLRPGTPVIASHVGAGLGRFLVGVFTGELLDEIPWPTAPQHADHVAHAATFMDAVSLGDPDSIPGAKHRAFRWLSTDEFNGILSRLRVRDDDAPLLAHG
jgi:hypothetical protein